MADPAAADVKAEKAAANGSAVGGCDAAAAVGQGKKRADQAVAFHELFSFADKWDLALMSLGSLGAVAHGAAMPCFFLLSFLTKLAKVAAGLGVTASAVSTSLYTVDSGQRFDRFQGVLPTSSSPGSRSPPSSTSARARTALLLQLRHQGA
jgi:hypothetical protein